MHIITICPLCNEDFMYHATDVYLIRDITVVDEVGNNEVIETVICQDCDSKEEPKQSIIKTEEDAKIFIEALENIPEPNEKLKKAFKDFHKQETTLEEAAERSAIEQFEAGNSAYILGFTEGFKKASERSYSEEEVKILLVNIINEIEIRKQGIISKSETMPVHLLEGGCMAFESSIDVIKESFEEFKNK